MAYDQEWHKHAANWQHGYIDALQCHRLNSMSDLSAIMGDIEDTQRTVAGEASRQYAAGLAAGVRRCMRHRLVMNAVLYPQRGMVLFTCMPRGGR